MFQSFDLRTTISLIIGCGILAAMLVLIGIVLCLYSKVSKAMNVSRDAYEVKQTLPAKDDKDNKSVSAQTTAAEHLQCCDECNMYSDVDSLPPCFCDKNEGI